MDYKAQQKAWTARRARIFSFIEKGFTLAEIGRRLGISRQRVSQIARARTQ